MSPKEIQEIYDLVVAILNKEQSRDASWAAYKKLSEKYNIALPEEKTEIFQKVLDCLTNVSLIAIAK